MTSQLVLDLGPPPPPSFASFVVGDNVEALASVRALLEPSAARPRPVYLWGPAASGRSHLLGALHGACGHGAARRLDPASPQEAFVFDASVRLWTIDDVDRLDAPLQAAAFHLYDAIGADGAAVLACAGEQPPARLALMPELATRLGWGLVLQLRRLSDADTAHALANAFAERGIAVAPDVVQWLMTHAPRDLGSLRARIEAIDRHALALKRAVTVPLLRELSQTNRPLGPP